VALDWMPLDLTSGQLSINNTVDQLIALDIHLDQETQFIHLPHKLTESFHAFVIADCEAAEEVSGQISPLNTLTLTQTLKNAYKPPIYLMPVTRKSWYLNGDALYFKQISPAKPAKALLNEITAWSWEKSGKFLRLFWSNTDDHTHVWVLGNAL